MKAMWTSGPPPPELIDFLLRETYHCTPSELEQEDAVKVTQDLIIMDVRARVQAMKYKKTTK